LDYCSSSWYSGLTVKLKNRLDVIQRKMVRYVLNKQARDHVGNSDLKSLSWLTIPDRVKYFKAIHVHKIFSNMAPSYLVDRFTRTRNVHDHHTRGGGFNFHVRNSGGSMGTGFAVTAVGAWNSLPDSLKACGNLGNFKCRVKEFLMARY
jgi:hypothetical protein